MKQQNFLGFLEVKNYIECLAEYDKTSLFELTVHHNDQNRSNNEKKNLKFCHRHCHKRYHAQHRGG